MKSGSKKPEPLLDPNTGHAENNSPLITEKTSYHKYWALAGIVSIFAVCAARLFIKVNTPSPFVNNLPTVIITILAIYVLVWTAKFYQLVNSTQYKILLIASLFIVFAIGISNSNIGQRGYSKGFRTFYKIPAFKGFRTHQDSPGYCKSYWKGGVRPPVYYTFISLVLGRDPSNLFKMPKGESRKYFLEIVKAQRLLLGFGWLLCCFAMMDIISPPIVAALFLGFFSVNNLRPVEVNPILLGYAIPAFISFVSMAVLLYKRQVDWKRAMLFSCFVVPLMSVLLFLGSHTGFVSEQINSILSDSLAQTFLMIITALAILFYDRGWRSLLPLTALFCGLLYQTRPAAIYACVVMGIMIIYALIRNFRTYLIPTIASVIVLLIMLLGPSMSRKQYNKLHKISSAPAHLGWSKLLFAIQIADAEDIQYIKTKEGKKFFRLAMERKRKLDKEFKPKLKWQWQFLPLNLYKVAEPIMSIYKMDRANILSDVCDPILLHGFDRYLNIVLESYLYSMRTSRLSSVMSVWVLLFMSLVLMLWVRGKSALIAGTLIATHMANYLVICMFTNPCLRFTDASEILVIIAMFILVVDATCKIFESRPKALLSENSSAGFISFGNFDKKTTLSIVFLILIFLSSGIIFLTSHVRKVRFSKDTQRISTLRKLISAAKLYHEKHKYLPTSGPSKYVELKGSWNSIFTKACDSMVKDGFLKETPKDDKENSYFYFPDNFFYFPGKGGTKRPQAAILGVILASKPEVIRERLQNEWKDIKSILFTDRQSYGGASFTTDLSKRKVSVLLNFSDSEENEMERISNLRKLILAIKLYHKKYKYIPTSGTSEHVNLTGSWNGVFIRACEQMVEDGFLEEVPNSYIEYGYVYYPGVYAPQRPQAGIVGVKLTSKPEVIKERLQGEWKDINSVLFTEKQAALFTGKQSAYIDSFTTNLYEGKVSVLIDFGKTEEVDMKRISNLRKLILAIKLYHKKYKYVPTSGVSEYVNLAGSWKEVFIRAYKQVGENGFLKTNTYNDMENSFLYFPGGNKERKPQTAVLGVMLTSKPEDIKKRLQDDWKDINSILFTKKQNNSFSPFYTDLSKSRVFVIIDFNPTLNNGDIAK